MGDDKELEELLAELGRHDIIPKTTEPQDYDEFKIKVSQDIEGEDIHSQDASLSNPLTFQFNEGNPHSHFVETDIDVTVSEDVLNETQNFSFEDEKEESTIPYSQMTEEERLLGAVMHEGKSREMSDKEFSDVISDVLQTQEQFAEEEGMGFYATTNYNNLLKERFEEERSNSLLNVQNNVLSLQEEEEEITEFILCEGIYDDSFKIFMYESPLIIDGDMPLVLELSGDYILFRRINPEPKVINCLLKTLPNFKFTYVNGENESAVTPFSFLGKCNFTN